MKRLFAALIVLSGILGGCAGKDPELERAMALRAKLLGSDSVAFDTVITADYGDKTYSFTLACTADRGGNVTFSVKEPETISGIEGTVSGDGGKLTFDDMVLDFGLLADGQVSPVSVPWLLIHTLRSGYLTACGMDGELLRVSIDDSYAENALHLDIWLGEEDLPVSADIRWENRRILSAEVKNFEFL